MKNWMSESSWRCRLLVRNGKIGRCILQTWLVYYPAFPPPLFFTGDCEAFKSLTDNILTAARIGECGFEGSVCSVFCTHPQLFIVSNETSTYNLTNNPRQSFESLTNMEKLNDFCQCADMSHVDCFSEKNTAMCSQFCYNRL